ncbi:Endonuclease NucS [subsurface metagenome]
MAKNKTPKLKSSFPFYDVFNQFLKEYSRSRSYWYIPKARSLAEKTTVSDLQRILQIVSDEFLDEKWNRDTQDRLLRRLIGEGVLAPYRTDSSKEDRTALVRINIVLLRVLGLLWVEDDNTIVITDAGLQLLAEDREPSIIIESQITKWQYPNPTMEHLVGFKGILPYLFLLQVLQRVRYKISYDEFELFVNLAQAQEDLEKTIRYIKTWRELSKEEQTKLLELVKEIPLYSPSKTQLSFDDESIEETNTRHRRIHLNSAYQRAFYTYPHYLRSEDGYIIFVSTKEVGQLIKQKLKALKIPPFSNKADWFAYYGDPEQQPSWFTYLSLAIERTESRREARKFVQEAQEQLTEEQVGEIQRKEIEKGIEDFYVTRLSQIEEGLKLVKHDSKSGRQYSTPIGSIDLLCEDKNNTYVVIEIKAGEAKDSVFGQILRYIGWVHRNLEGGYKNVRGIILAGGFPETARYSRIGLEVVTEDYQTFLRFKRHGLQLQNI